MSRENVEIVRAVYEAVARRDSATVLGLYHPDVEWDASRLPESALQGWSVVRGHEELRSFFREWNEAWESFEDHCEEVIDAGDRVVSIVNRRGRGRASGAETTTRQGGVWTIHDGKVVRVVWFPSVEEAIEAAGLGEQPTSQQNVPDDRIEVVRRVYTEWARGNFRAGVELFAPDVVFTPGQDILPAPRRGPAEVEEYMRDFLAQFDGYTMDAEEIVGRDDKVFVAARQRARGKASGLAVEGVGYAVWTFRDREVTSFHWYVDRGEALEAAGLQDSAASHRPDAALPARGGSPSPATDYVSPQFDAIALVSIDVQRDLLDGQPYEIAGTSAAAEVIGRLCDVFRRVRRPIVHVVRLYRPDGSNADLCRRGAIKDGMRLVIAGTAGAEVAEGLVPEGAVLDTELLLGGGIQELGPGEVAIFKPRWGAFYNTPLEGHLHRLGVSTLAFCGCNFPNCPRTSIYEASERDFRVVVVEDAISGLYDRGRDELRNIGVRLMTSEEVMASLRTAAATTA